MNKVVLSEYGILPNTDITISLYKLFSQFKTDTEFVFEEGDYYFSPKDEMKYDYRISNSDYIPKRALGIWFFPAGPAQQIIYADTVEIGQGVQYRYRNIQSVQFIIGVGRLMDS